MPWSPRARRTWPWLLGFALLAAVDLLWFDARELELIEHFSSVGRV